MCHTSWKKLAELQNRLLQVKHVIEYASTLHQYIATPPPVKNWLSLLRTYLKENYELHRVKASKLRAFLASDTARSFSLEVAKYPIGQSVNEVQTRAQIKSVLQSAYDHNTDVVAMVIDGDFSYLALRDFDGSALTRNEMLRQLHDKWSTKTHAECFSVVDRKKDIRVELKDSLQGPIRLLLQAFQHPRHKTVKIEEGKEWLKKEKGVTHVYATLDNVTLPVLRLWAAKSQVS